MGGKFLRFASITPLRVRVIACETAVHAVIEVGGKRYRAIKCTDDGVPFLAYRDSDEIKDGE